MQTENKKFFVIDDERDLTALLSRMLQALGAQKENIQMASSFDEVNNLIPTIQNSSVILLNFHLDSQTSLPLIEKLQKTTPDAKIVVITGDSSSETQVACLKLGLAGILTKPFSLEEFKKTIIQASI